MTSDERDQHYKTLFSKHNKPLHKLEFPSQAAEYPHLAHEINAAYLRHTIFTVEVWMNYDTVASRFYYDARAQDCGRLRLPPKMVNRQLVNYEYGRIRFELRTPFGRLGSVLVAVEPTEVDVGVRFRTVKPILIRRDHPMLREGVRIAADNIIEQAEPHGREGMNFEDLVVIAKRFCLRPASEMFTKGGWLRNHNVWMNVERPNEPNTGFLQDIEECGIGVEDAGVSLFNGE